MSAPRDSFRFLLPILFIPLCAGCELFGKTSPTLESSSVAITDYRGTFNYSLDLGSSAHDVYFVFTNTDLNLASSGAPAVRGVQVDGLDLPGIASQPAGASGADGRGLEGRIARDSRELAAGLGSTAASRSLRAPARSTAASPRAADVAGGASAGMTIMGRDDALVSAAATCRYAGPAGGVADGSTRSLDIWVADDCWAGSAPAGSKKHLVTQDMVDALAAKFLVPGTGNDIYDWDTAVLGAEWGDRAAQLDSALIPFDRSITILLADIEDDDADSGGVVGYFYMLNNLTNESLKDGKYGGASNERIMFVVDSVMYANPDAEGYGAGDAGYYKGGTWTGGGYWAEEVYSTLAHEFQHMIQFYQKGIIANNGGGSTADAWIDEMCSQLMEDLVAEKLGVPGPRGVSASDGGAGSAGNKGGRIPIFNKYLSLQLTNSSSNYELDDYSFSYAFGSWLLRNYGGADFLRNVVRSKYTDSKCVTDAVETCTGLSLTMSDLLSRWAVAVLGSERTDMPLGYRYNTGTWTSYSEGENSYKLGSINFFNYSPVPQVLSASSRAAYRMEAASNVYYQAASGATGFRTWRVTVPDGVRFSAFVTP